MTVRSRAWRALGLSALVLAVLTGCGEDDETPPEASGDAACSYSSSGGPGPDGVETPAADPAWAGDVEAVIVTGEGDIGITLHADDAPCTVHSFLSLTEQDYYDDTVCHRLTTEGIFVLQCGDPDGTGRGGPGYTIPDELDGSETYPAGTIAMANTGMPDSGGSQFFLVYEDTFLPPDYTVFGTMDADGTDFVRSIAAEGVDPTAGGGSDGPPARPVTITAVTVD